jgi:ribosomal protein S18 acetylase RimI-like enzyme
MNALDARTHLAHGDAWQAEGSLRARSGGGAAEWPAVRLMASGLPHARWNSGDLLDLACFDVAAVRAWYAARANGAGVAWGIRVPAGSHFPHGQRLFTARCMALAPEQFVAAPLPASVTIDIAAASDIETIARIDAGAFDDTVDDVLPWIAPHVGAGGFTLALARLDGVPVGIATAVATDDRAGRCASIFGVAVLPAARRRGIAAAVTSWLLERAFDAGATFAHLNPNHDEAARVYARLGFVETAGLDIYADL